MTATTSRLSRPIDPFAPTEPVYVDDLVEVRGFGTARPRRTLGMVRTDHFDVEHADGRIRLGHRIQGDELHAGVAGLVAEELFGPGWLRGADLFERIVTGVVLSSRHDPLTAWEAFYRNSLREIDVRLTGCSGSADERPSSSLSGYAPVYALAERLLAPGPVIELGACFGFFSLRQAAERDVTAVDLSAGAMSLLRAVAPRLGTSTSLTTVVSDAADVPLEDGVAETVVALHLLEHLDAADGEKVIAEAVRLARRRVVVAVPLEDEPDETWGHVRSITLTDLAASGRATGLPFDVREHHGGWLVLDTCPGGPREAQTRPAFDAS